MQPNDKIKLDVQCFHCGDTVANMIEFDNKQFCCNGCKSVYSILNKNNLCTYYDLNKNPGLSQKQSFRKDKFQFLDDANIKAKLIQFTNGEKTQITFYLPQIHCSSCLWLLENFHLIQKGVISTRVNFTKKELFVVFNEAETSLRQIAESLSGIGYEPHLNLQDIQSNTIKTTSNTQRILKIGIVGFCFANIMMMSFPEYLSAGKTIEPFIANAFRLFIVILSLPVLLYGASEFFVSAYSALKHKYLNIDAPVALAILVTFFRSLYEVYSGEGNGYFDSMSGIVFFMLIGRWLQDKTYQTISFDRDYKSFFPIAVNVIKNGKIYSTPVENVQQEDIIQIHHGEIIPVDAILSKGEALIDYSFVSGESTPVSIQKGEMIYAGAKQTGTLIELITVKETSFSYLTNLWNNSVFKAERTVKPNIYDIIGKYFSYFVLILGATAALYWYYQHETKLMWNAITTVLIVACPCALLLASNFTNGNVLRVLGLNGFYLRSHEVLDDILKINHIVFDKTGTLTQREMNNVIYEGKVLSEDEKNVIASILKHSSHPLSVSIAKYLNVTEFSAIENFKEQKGLGVEAWVNEQHIKIGSADFVGVIHDEKKTSVFVKREKEVLGKFTFENVYRYGIWDLIQKLSGNYTISVLSGDNDSELNNLKKVIHDENAILFNQKPEMKMQYIDYLQNNKKYNVMMIGDGLNDAIALKKSNVGIAVAENTNNFTPAADGIITADKLSLFNTYLEFIQNGKKIVWLCFAISILYNVIGLYFAIQGVLSPLIAAILMPLSSLTIIGLTFGLTNFLANKYKINYTS